MEARIARIETHVEHLNAGVADVRTSLVRLDTKMDSGFVRLDAKMDAGFERLDAKMDAGFERLDAKIDSLSRRLDAKIDKGFLILGGMIVSLGIGMTGLMAKGFHWL